MTRKSWIYTSGGRCIEKGSPEHDAYLGELYGDAPMVSGDEDSFVSPIDGKVYSGKAGMREHNRRHDVVNNRDLSGLQVGINPHAAPPPRSTREREKLRQSIYDAAMRGRHLEGQ